MKEFPFHTFINLVKFDQQIVALEASLAVQEQKLKEVEQQMQAYALQLEQAQQLEHDAQKLVDMKELDAKALDVRSAKIKYNLDNVANPKEYASLSKELAKVQAEQLELEASLLDAWHRLETTKRERQRTQAGFQEQHDAIAAQIHELEQEIDNQDNQIDQLYEQRAQHMQGIPEEWLQKYDVMRNRVSDPVVAIKDKNCSACGYQLSEPDLIRLGHRALLQCKHCFRFLYDTVCVYADPS